MAAQNAYKLDYAYGTAPAYQPERKRKTENEPKVELKRVKKTREVVEAQNKKANNKVLVRFMAAVCVFFALYAVVCNSFAARNDAKHELDAKKESYVYAMAENRELKVKLNHLISAENIDRIAVEQLGLIKVAAGNEIYLDNQSENEVIYFKGK